MQMKRRTILVTARERDITARRQRHWTVTVPPRQIVCGPVLSNYN